MKTKIYTKMLLPLSLFGLLFRVLEIIYAIDPENCFYYLESFIPLLFNIYIFLVIAFFLSELFLIKTESKSLRKRFGAIGIADKIIMIASAVFILGSALRDIFVESEINFSFENFTDLLTDTKFYTLIFAVITCIFIVFFASDPKRYSVNSVMAILSLSLTFYYLLRLFTRFLDLNEILSKAYSTHTILLLGFIVLSCLNISKILAGLRVRKYFVAFGHCAVFLSVLHLAEFVMHLLPGNPYNIPVDSIFSYIADFLVSFLIFRFILLISNKQDKKDKSVSGKDDSSSEINKAPDIVANDEKVEITENT